MSKFSPGCYPFWFWNDRLSESEIRWQISQMAEQGMRGFFIHPRQGLNQPYLSDAFFKMVEFTITVAKEHDLMVHLYDEYPYPSGVAGGEVILGEPRFHATQLRQSEHVTEGGCIRIPLTKGKTLSCVAYPVQNGTVDWNSPRDLKNHIGMFLQTESYNETGLTMYNRKRYFASDPVPVLEIELEGSHKIFTSTQIEWKQFKYWNNYVDVLNPAAIQKFIETTHERYRNRIGKHFGQSVSSIFVDETTPHWSTLIPDKFQEAYGYDLLPLLPALQDASHPDHVRISRDLYQLKYEMFADSFERPVAKWCQDNGLLYSGEKPSLRLSQLRFMDIPGCDPGHTKAGAPLDILKSTLRSNAKATASAAYFYEKSGALCECYHSLGWSGTLQDAKLIAEGLLLMGIKYLVPHGFFYSTHALKKHDAPPSFFFQMPFWPLTGKLFDHLQNILDLFEDTWIDAQILVIDPSSGLPSKKNAAQYELLLGQLMRTHLDFHIVDTDILEQGQIKNGELQVADLQIKAVILPPMKFVESPLEEWLETFESEGGWVIRMTPEDQAEDCISVLQTRIKPSLSATINGQEAEGLQIVKRVGVKDSKEERDTHWFILNVTGETLTVDLSSNEGRLSEIPLSGNPPPTLNQKDYGYQRVFHPFESALIKLTPQPQPQPQVTVTSKTSMLSIPIKGNAHIKPLNSNLLRMHNWKMSLLDEQNQPYQSAMVPAIPLNLQLEKGKFRFKPKQQTYFGHEPELNFPQLNIRYEYTFQNNFDGPIEFVMEPGSIRDRWMLKINQSEALTEKDFSETTNHIRGSLGLDISAYAKAGENTITLDVTADHSCGGLLNPLYLSGDFAVHLNPDRLRPREAQGNVEAYETNGLPFYAGILEYETEINLDAPPAGKTILAHFDFEEPFHEAAEVSINGSAFYLAAWHPRIAEIPTTNFKSGKNQITTRVYTTLIRSFEGQWFDYKQHTYRDIGGENESSK